MKNLLHAAGFALALTPFTANSQMEVTHAEMLPFGSVKTLSQAQDHTLIDTVTQGTGVTWNMTNLTVHPTGSDLVVEIVDPTLTPFGSSFPSSNYAYSENSGAAYRYFDLTTTKMERVGSFSGGTLRTYNDPQIEYVFPFGYGTQYTDTWDNDVSSFGGTYSFKCIGTGTLNLPGASFPALMVRVHFTEGSIEFDIYFWYHADNGAILIQYVVGDGIWIPTSARFSTGLTLGTTKLEAIANLTYNNPVTDQLTLSFQNTFGSSISYSLMDLNGRLIKEGAPQLSDDKVVIQDDFSELQNGMYLLTISDADNGKALQSIRIIKQ